VVHFQVPISGAFWVPADIQLLSVDLSTEDILLINQ